MNKKTSEWTSKEELAKVLKIPVKEIDYELTKLIDNSFVEEKDGQYKVNDSDGKGLKRIESFLDDLKNIDRYFPTIRHGYLHLKHKFEKQKEYPKEVIEYSKKAGFDITGNSGETLLDDAELFEIDKKTIWILQLTTNQIYKRQMPYKRIVIDCDLEIDDKWFKGFFVGGGLVMTYWGNNDGFCDNYLIFDAFEEKEITKYFQKDLKKSTIKKLKMFICNFFDFINNPEVRIIRFERSKKNRERRERDGKEPLPSSNKIRVSGTLKTYYEKLEVTGNKLNYRFWVRGHFMKFWNKKRFAKLYSLLEKSSLPEGYYVDEKIRKDDKIIALWKKSYIKGSGILVTKRYEVKK